MASPWRLHRTNLHVNTNDESHCLADWLNSVQGLPGGCAFLFLLRLCAATKVVQLSLIAVGCVYSPTSITIGPPSGCLAVVNYLPSQNRILLLSPTAFGPNRCAVILPAASSQRVVYCLKSSSSATLRSPELTVCDPLLQFYPSHLVLPLGFAWSW